MEDIADYLNYDEACHVLQKYIIWRSHEHENKVSENAVIILDSLRDIFTVSKAEYNMLQYSAMLHDIGCFINKNAHHKHTSYIIYNDSAFDCLPVNIRSILALVAAGHRKSMGKSIKNHNEHEQVFIMRLASILRLADALDHTHNIDVRINNIKADHDSLVIFLKGEDTYIAADRTAKKSDLFRECFNLEVILKNAK